MPRATNGPATLARRKKVLKKAKGYFGNKSRLFRYAKDAVDRAEVYAYCSELPLKIGLRLRSRGCCSSAALGGAASFA